MAESVVGSIMAFVPGLIASTLDRLGVTASGVPVTVPTTSTSITAGVGSPTALVAGDSGKRIDNAGTTVKAACTLPTAAANLNLYFQVVDADGLRINANTGDDIRIGDQTCTTAGYFESTRIGSIVRLFAIDATTWVALEVSGTWRADSTTTAGYAYTPTAWTTTTFTGSWSANTTYVGMARQVGDTLEGKVSVRLAGAPTSAELTIGLPTFNGVATAIDTAKLLTANGAGDGSVILGEWAYLDSGTATRIGGWVTTRGDFSTATAIRFFLGTSIASTGLSDATGLTQAAPVTFANGDRVNLTFSVPVL